MEATNDANRAAATQHASTAQSLARILREHRDIQRNQSPHWTAAPLSLEEPREWHFTLRGPPDSPFEGGLYHGRIVLPKNYPFAPPSLMLLTRNGRFEVNKKICLSASSHHPELWQPAWGIRTLLDALCAFFPTPAQGALHSLEASEKERRQMALESVLWVCPVCKRANRQLVEEGCAAPTEAIPELPAQLKAQALLARRNDNRTVDPETVRPDELQAGAHRAEAPEQAAAFSSSSSSGDGSSSSSNGSARAAEEASLSRRHPRQPRPLWVQVLRLPADRTELLITTADAALLLLLLMSLLLLADLLLQPPQFSILQPSPFLSS